MEKNKRVLLHCCCAPDSTVPLQRLSVEGWDIVCAFYGSNIQPEEEFRWRLDDLKKITRLSAVPLRVLPYDPNSWIRATRFLASEPEGGSRCGLCFALQLISAARCALEEGCGYLCTTLTISPHKDPGRIHRIGKEISAKNGLEWLDRTWRKGGGFLESIHESRRLGLRRQDYCGCRYSSKGDETA
jgi:predicted adenine nucleotide alpha hydrolase (AANH) superfamily ATPase